jgi:hypothetical protein
MYHVTFPPQSNRASWVFIGLVTDLDSNPIDLSACSMVFQISPKREGASSGYGDNYDTSTASGSLLASTANGKLTIVDLGTFRWFFTLQDMQSLCPGTYDTGLTLTNDDGTQTVQLSVGPLAIVDGVVP